MVSVLDPVSGTSIAEEKDYKASETTFSTSSFDVHTPSGGMSGHVPPRVDEVLNADHLCFFVQQVVESWHQVQLGAARDDHL
jgi:hypothetical protein